MARKWSTIEELFAYYMLLGFECFVFSDFVLFRQIVIALLFFNFNLTK